MLVTSDADGTLLDRRRVHLVDEGLPTIPHHSEAQRLPLEQAVQLVERVRASAERHSIRVLDAVARDVPGVLGVALRQCPELPPTIGECITNYRAQNLADWVMYRRALAAAAEARGWSVHWFDPRRVAIDDHIVQLRRTVGPPWGQDHKMAMAAAMAAANGLI